MGFLGYLYPLTLVLYVVGLGSATHVLLFLCQGEVVHLGNLLSLTWFFMWWGWGAQRMYFYSFAKGEVVAGVIKIRKAVLLCRAVLI